MAEVCVCVCVYVSVCTCLCVCVEMYMTWEGGRYIRFLFYVTLMSYRSSVCQVLPSIVSRTDCRTGGDGDARGETGRKGQDGGMGRE